MHYRLCCSGMVPHVTQLYIHILTFFTDITLSICSCLAHRDDLDAKLGKEDRRSEKIDEKLRQSVPSQEMWKEWGTPDHVMVCALLLQWVAVTASLLIYNMI